MISCVEQVWSSMQECCRRRGRVLAAARWEVSLGDYEVYWGEVGLDGMAVCIALCTMRNKICRAVCDKIDFLEIPDFAFIIDDFNRFRLYCSAPCVTKCTLYNLGF